MPNETPGREGPRVTIGRDCSGCVHLTSTYYAIQGDSGFDLRCSKLNIAVDNGTPDSCPFIATPIEAANAAMLALDGPQRVQVIRHYLGSARKAIQWDGRS